MYKMHKMQLYKFLWGEAGGRFVVQDGLVCFSINFSYQWYEIFNSVLFGIKLRHKPEITHRKATQPLLELQHPSRMNAANVKCR